MKYVIKNVFKALKSRSPKVSIKRANPPVTFSINLTCRETMFNPIIIATKIISCKYSQGTCFCKSRKRSKPLIILVFNWIGVDITIRNISTIKSIKHNKINPIVSPHPRHIFPIMILDEEGC